MILVLDQQGFTTNILRHQLGAVPMVTATELAALNLDSFTHVIITHGPQQTDLARLRNVPQLPVLAIGSASQQLAAAYGHTAVGPVQPVYGEQVAHHHDATGLFQNLPNPVNLVSYHPWRLTAMDPDRLTPHAVDHDDSVLAFRVKGTNHWGMHADPAALLSTQGATLLHNFLALAQPKPVDAVAPGPRPAPQRVQLLTRTVAGELNTAATFRRLQHDATAAFWFDSAAAHRGQGNLSIMGTNAGPLAQTVRWDAKTTQLHIHQDNTTRQLTGDVLAYLDAHTWHATADTSFEGFTGGWVGYLGYEALHTTATGRASRWPANTPDAYWIRPQAFLRYDHTQQVTTLCAVADAALLDHLEEALQFGPAAAPPSPSPAKSSGRWRLTDGQYQDRIHRIQTMLKTGQAAGICLTDTFELHPYAGDGLALYERLRRNNPAPYAGYFRFNTCGDELEILSASPEKFLSIDASGVVESKPIKGTVARSSDPVVDDARAKAMATDPKYQSENLMIADLLRDDLTKVTVPGSVQVPKLMAVETFATLHQLVTTVTGQLLPDAGATDALRALFPGGSMTGAPKLTSIEALEELEAGPRGIYSGAMGWLGGDNTAEFNVIIRTIVLDSGHLSIGAGGAIVVDSDPQAEVVEKQLKAQALLDSLGIQT
jgi:para-aminobenzoate synthetase